MKLKGQISLFSIVILAATLFWGCKKQDAGMSIIPHLEYQSYSIGTDSMNNPVIKVTFSFADGDGDLGLRDEDTSGNYSFQSKYYFNLYGDYYAYIGNAYVKIWRSYPFSDDSLTLAKGGDTIKFNGRIPVITPPGRNKSITGTIEYNIPYTYLSNVPSNRIKYKLWMYDRALHRSNEIETPEIVVN
jgi:hypothetical protein